HTGRHWVILGGPHRAPPLKLPSPPRELLSFLIARRGAATKSSEGAEASSEGALPQGGWARVTAPVRPRPRRVHLSLCCPDGALRRTVVTAARHGRPLYRQARASRWGDLLPAPVDDVTP
ncbi:MET17 protein, partial [Penelope pileata]|nr:MET17 protein [Penelope pileata]